MIGPPPMTDREFLDRIACGRITLQEYVKLVGEKGKLVREADLPRIEIVHTRTTT